MWQNILFFHPPYTGNSATRTLMATAPLCTNTTSQTRRGSGPPTWAYFVRTIHKYVRFIDLLSIGSPPLAQGLFCLWRGVQHVNFSIIVESEYHKPGAPPQPVKEPPNKSPILPTSRGRWLGVFGSSGCCNCGRPPKPDTRSNNKF